MEIMPPSVVPDMHAVDNGGSSKTAAAAAEINTETTTATTPTRSLSSSSLLSASLRSSSTSSSSQLPPSTSSSKSSSFETSMFRCLPYDYKFLIRLVEGQEQQQQEEEEEESGGRNDQDQKKRLKFLYGCPNWSQLVPIGPTQTSSSPSPSPSPSTDQVIATKKMKMTEGDGTTRENGNEKSQDHQQQVHEGGMLTDDTLDLLIKQYKELLRTNNSNSKGRSSTGNKVTFEVPCVRFHDTTKPCERWSVTLFLVDTGDEEDDDSSDDGNSEKEKKTRVSLGVGGLISKQDLSHVPPNDQDYEELQEQQQEEEEEVQRDEKSTQQAPTAKIEDLEKEVGHFRGLFQHLPNAYCMSEIVTDEQTGETIDHRYIEVNHHFEDMSGLKDVVGKRWTELIPGIENDPGDWIGRTARVVSGGEVDTFTRYSERQERWFRGITYSPSKGKSITMFTDITEEMELETSLLESEEKHRTLFETMNQGVTYLNSDFSYSNPNPAALELLGLTLDQFQGRTSMDPRWSTIHEDGTDWPSHDHPVNHVFATGKPEIGKVMGVYNPSDDEYRWLSIDCMPRFRPGEEKPYLVCNVFTDVTDVKQTEIALKNAKEKAEEADKLKSAFLATMSHEIRTPLNGIMGHLDLILSNDLDEAHREENLEGLNVALHSGKLLISIIEDILDLSKIEAGQLDIVHKPFSLLETIEQTMQLSRAYQIQRKKESVDLRHSIEGLFAGGMIYGDQFRLRQILNNFMSNAIKFTTDGYVSLSVRQENGLISFCVQDTGKGIPEEKLDTIFDAFRQVELSDTREHGGTGLGLTICRRLIKLMRGTIRVESETKGENRGTRFFVTLPFEAVAEEDIKNLPKIDSQNSLASQEYPVVFNGGKILVAEDDLVSRKLVQNMLKKLDREAIMVRDGLEAVETYKKRRSEIAMIFSDICMPVMSGLEATRQIRNFEDEAGDGHRVPIVALSAGAMKGDKEKGVEYGMDDYVTKPISRKALAASVEKHTGRPPVHRSYIG